MIRFCRFVFVVTTLVLITNCQQRNSEIQSVKHPSINVLSYNTYLLAKGLNNYSVARLDLIPDSLIAHNADIVLLQEVWHTKFKAVIAQAENSPDSGSSETIEDYFPLRLIEQLKNHYPYHAYHDTVTNGHSTEPTTVKKPTQDAIDSPVDQANQSNKTVDDNNNIGTGLVIFSKTPLKNIDFIPWEQVVDENELIAKKGVLYAETTIPGIGDLQLFNSHTSPKTFDIVAKDYKAEHSKIKNEQIQLLIDFMNKKNKQQNCQVLGIDLNSHLFNYDPKYDRFHEDLANISPIFTKLVEGVDLIPDTKPLDIIQDKTPIEKYATWNNKNNLLVQRGLYGTNPTSKIDFVFSSRNCTNTMNSKIVFQDRFKMHYSSSTVKPLRPLSDHFGVATEIFFYPKQQQISTTAKL